MVLFLARVGFKDKGKVMVMFCNLRKKIFVEKNAIREAPKRGKECL